MGLCSNKQKEILLKFVGGFFALCISYMFPVIFFGPDRYWSISEEKYFSDGIYAFINTKTGELEVISDIRWWYNITINHFVAWLASIPIASLILVGWALDVLNKKYLSLEIYERKIVALWPLVPLSLSFIFLCSIWHEAVADSINFWSRVYGHI